MICYLAITVSKLTVNKTAHFSWTLPHFSESVLRKDFLKVCLQIKEISTRRNKQTWICISIVFKGSVQKLIRRPFTPPLISHSRNGAVLLKVCLLITEQSILDCEHWCDLALARALSSTQLWKVSKTNKLNHKITGWISETKCFYQYILLDSHE